MNTENLNHLIDGKIAKFFELPEQPIEGPITEQTLKDLGIPEQDVPKEAAQAIKDYADRLKKEGKRPRAIRRAVAKKFNIRLLD